MRISVLTLTGVFLAVSMAACEDPRPAETVAQKTARAESMMPSDARLAEIYARTCKACHVSPDSGAPLAGDREAWRVRLEADNGVVAVNLQSGIRSMPPRGQCLDCSDADLWSLTLFMAQKDVPE